MLRDESRVWGVGSNILRIVQIVFFGVSHPGCKKLLILFVSVVCSGETTYEELSGQVEGM